MDHDSDYDPDIDAEVTQARLEGVLEDTRDQHDVSFEDLNNMEVLTLSTVFHHGTEAYLAQGAEEQAKFVRSLDARMREQADSLFDELRDIHEPVVEHARAESDAQSKRDEAGGVSRWTSPFRNAPQGDPTERAWRFTGALVLVQAVVAVANIVWTLSAPALGLPAMSWAMHLVVAVAGVFALSAISFAIGFGRSRYGT